MPAGNSTLTFSFFGKDVSASKTIEGIGNNAATVAGKLGKVGDSLVGAGKKLTLTVTTPLAAIAGIGIKTEKNFSRAMAQIGVAADVNGPGLQKLSDYAKRMGADTVFSAGEAADAMLELAKGGFKPAQIQGGALAATMALAAAGGMGLADSAGVTVAAMNTFGLAAKDANKIADALAGGANASSADVSDLGMALSQTGTAAKITGQSLNDTVGVLAALADNGVAGSDAGTSLKTFLTRLVPSTKQAIAAMNELDLSFVNADGSLMKLPEVAGLLQSKLKGLTQAQRVSALTAIFGTDAMRAATVVYDLGTDGVNKYSKATKERGSAQKMADAQMSGSAGAIEQMSGSLETAALTIGQALAPTVISLSNSVADLANWFTKLDPAAQQNIITWAAVAAGIGPVLIGFGKLTNGVKSAIDVTKGTINVTKKVAGGFKNLAIGFRTTGDAALGYAGPLGKVGRGMRNFIGGIGNGIKAVGSFTVQLAKNSAALAVNFAKGVAGGAKALASFTVEVAKNGVALAVTAAKTVAHTAASIASKTATLAVRAAQGLATAAQWLWNVAMSANPIGIVITAIAALVGAIVWVATQTTIFQDAWRVASAFLVASWKNVASVFTVVWTNVASFFTTVWNGIVAWFTKAIDAVVGFVRTHWGLILSLFIGPLGLVIQWIVEHWSGIVNFFKVAVNRIGGFFGSVFGGIGGIIRGAFNGAVGFVKGIFNNIIGVVNGVISGLNKVTSKGAAIGIHIGKIPKIPKLAEGGIATAATIAMIGEGSEPEVVQPLSSLKRMLDDRGTDDSDRRGDRGGGLHMTFEMRNGPTFGEVMQDALWLARKAGWRPA